MNILITSAGRRTTLVSAFVEAAHARGGRVIAGDVDGLAPSLYLADTAVRTRGIDDPGYVTDLVGLIREHDVDLIVPTIDTDLLVLAGASAALAAVDCRAVVSSSDFVAITMDKFATGEAFGAAGVRVPRSWLPPIPADSGLPDEVFVKPRDGSASKDTHAVRRADLASILAIVPRAVVQELLVGPEITIDALLDLEGVPIHYVPRARIKTLGGESIQGRTLEHDAVIERWVEDVLRVCARLGARGPLTIQAFLTADGIVLSEVNPRFGGGFPLALAAGADYPAWLLDMASGVTIEPRLGDYEAGLFMTRYNVERFLRQPLW